MKLNFIIVVFIALCFCSCAKKKLNPVDYIKWISDSENGLKQTKEIGGIMYQVSFQPLDLMVLKEYNDLRGVTQKMFNEKKKMKEGLQYYIFQMKLMQAKSDLLHYKTVSESEYFKRANYYSFAVQKDIKLIDGSDTLACVLCNFEQNYGTAPTVTIVTAFNATKKVGRETRTFCFNDIVFGNGEVRIEMDKNNLINIPDLIIK